MLFVFNVKMINSRDSVPDSDFIDLTHRYCHPIALWRLEDAFASALIGFDHPVELLGGFPVSVP